MISIDYLLLIAAILLLLSIVSAKYLQNLGIPTLLLFIGVGILAGSEGIGGIYFDDAKLAQSIGIISLVFILFSGGLETEWRSSKSVVTPAFLLASLGVILTAAIVGLFVMWIFDTSFLWGFLVGSIISSTDAAAVFSILRIGNINLKGRLKPLLELESGSNDPIAVFLTISSIELILNPEMTFPSLLWALLLQISLGLLFGFGGGRIIVFLLNRLNFYYEGIYPIFAMAIALLIYSSTAVIGGSGFLAIYIAGIIMGNMQFVHKRSLVRFFDGFAVLSQISMFLTLGLLVFPSDLIKVTYLGLLLSFILIFIARPLGVFITLIPFKFSFKEKLFTSWVGLRGAVPIILATFPLLMGIENSRFIFDLVFFIVLTSVFVQGWSIRYLSKLLNLAEPMKKKVSSPIEFTADTQNETELIELFVPSNSSIIGKQIVELNFPINSRIILVVRDEKNLVPNGGTIIEEGDIISILVERKSRDTIQKIFYD
ncbi:MAG TPA: potassium/proton antiporter [Ignavibacteriaceae bacterium]|nr:potassium/proton antiporter [Ignavibacteriaceae bacterium]